MSFVTLCAMYYGLSNSGYRLHNCVGGTCVMYCDLSISGQFMRMYYIYGNGGGNCYDG